MEMNVTGMQREPILLTRWTNIANKSLLDQGYLQSSFSSCMQVVYSTMISVMN